MVNYSDCDCDHKFQWKEGKCKHKNPISQLKHPIINRNDEKWQNEISPDAECWVARRPLSALGGLSARQVAEVGEYDDGPTLIFKYMVLFQISSTSEAGTEQLLLECR